jgi:catechol 2,3-dioxygenase-like lactoylglutathione lyase family enzyme
VTVVDITINASLLPHVGPDASLAFRRDVLGFEVRDGGGHETMRRITVGPEGRPDMSIVLEPPALDAAFERSAAADADVVQEPIEQPYGGRDCAVRDPAGNLIRIHEVH